MTEPTISLGDTEPSQDTIKRLSMLIWGQSGVGKTTLASTMPGKIALINFDPDGPASIPDADNVTTYDLSGKGDQLATQFKSTNPLSIEDIIPHYDSFVFDSLTTASEKALGVGIGITKGATVERPSPGAYGARNNLINTLIRHVLSITGRDNKHVCFIAHEGTQDKNDDGVLQDITLALGGQLPQNTAIKINECWNLFEDGKGRKMILCRKARMRTPLKSRMFNTKDSPEFEWQWNVDDRDDPTNMRISDWWEEWKSTGQRLPLPTKKASR